MLWNFLLRKENLFHTSVQREYKKLSPAKKSRSGCTFFTWHLSIQKRNDNVTWLAAFLQNCLNVIKAWFPPGDTFLEIEIKTPLLFPGHSDIFKVIFFYRPINFNRQLILTKLTLSPNLEEKSLSWKQRDGMQTSLSASGIISFDSTSM